MSFKEVKWSPRLLKYWRDEQNGTKWFKESLSTDNGSDDSFERFCKRHRMFEIDKVTLLYLDYIQPNIVMLHISVLRKKRVNIDDLIAIRDQLFSEGVEWVFGWVAKQNRKLRAICEVVGMEWNGEVDDSAIVKGKPFIKYCYSLHQAKFLVVEKGKNLLSFV